MNDIMITVHSACLSSEGRQILIHNIVRNNYILLVISLISVTLVGNGISKAEPSLAGQTSKMLALPRELVKP